MKYVMFKEKRSTGKVVHLASFWKVRVFGTRKWPIDL